MKKSGTSKSGRKRATNSEHYTSRQYRPYVTAIGQIALAWNDLHEAIGVFFYSIIALADSDGKIEAAFQAVDSDRTKRKMLKAGFSNLDPKERQLNPRAIEDVKWLCNQIDALEEARNNAIHSPLHSFDALPLPDLPKGVQPNYVYGNLRAAKLRDKDLLSEYRYVRDATIALRDFAHAIEESWNWTSRGVPTFPQRPQLPNRGQKKSMAGPRSGSKQPQLPLPSSLK